MRCHPWLAALFHLLPTAPRWLWSANLLTAKRSSAAVFPAKFLMQIALSFLLLQPPATAAERCATSVARLVSLQGNITLWTPQAAFWQAANSGVALCPQDRIRVGVDSRAALLLTNETTVRLNQKTTVTINGSAEQSRSFIDLVNGAIHLITRTPTPFQIHTPFVNANIEGTEFAVAVTDTATTISVVEGKVAAENAQGRIVLTQGESGTATRNQAPTKNLRIRPLDAVQWALYYPTIFDSHPYVQSASAATVDAANANNTQQVATQLYRQGKITEAIAALDADVPSHATQNGHTRSADWLTFHAGLLLAVGQLDGAMRDIDQALQTDPHNRNAYALKTIIAVTQNDKIAARRFAEKATAAAPSTSEVPSQALTAAPLSATSSIAAAWLARSYAEQADFHIADALNSAREATRLAPQNALAWARRAELELSIGNQKNALDAASQAIRLNPDLSKIQTVLGFSYLIGMRTGEAKNAFLKAIKLDESDPQPRLGLGLAKIRSGSLIAGRTDIAIAASLDPADPLIRSYLGKAYFEEKRDALAATQFGLAKTLDPLDPTP